MAEGKEREKEKKEPKSRPDPVETIILLVFILFLLGAIVARLSSLFVIFQSGRYTTGAIGGYFTGTLFPILKLLSFGITGLAFVGIVWYVLALTKINVVLNAIYKGQEVFVEDVPEEKKNRRWERVLGHLNSTSPNDWKFAILEADIILDELLDVMNYRGETVSDKLKKVEASDFDTLDSAWEAHKIRNTIAHQGSDFVITEREARRVIDLYRTVFEEFNFI